MPKVNFKTRSVTGEKEGQCIIIRGSIQKRDLMIVNMCASNNGTSKFIKQKLAKLKEEIDNHTCSCRF